jgi:plastocyanin
VSRSRRRSGGAFVLALVVTVLGFGPWSVTPARAASATMTFTGALNVAGLLSAITVQPSSVTVPAGGEVEFVNATTAPLTVTVGAESARIEPDGSASMLFTGAAKQETFQVAATAFNVPVAGSLTSSAGRIVVLAVPPAAAADPPTLAPPRAMSSAEPEPSGAGSPAAPEQSPSAAGQSEDSPSPTVGSQPQGTVIPITPGASPGGTSRPGGPEPRASASAGRGAGPSEAVSSARSRGDNGSRVVADPVLPPFPGFSSRRDQLGLVLLLGATVLAGLCAALARTVLAYRPSVVVGAHSQAARKDRQWRRGR